MAAISVKASKLSSDAHRLSQHACEPAPVGRALEAHQAAARVHAAAGLGPAGHENTVAGREAQQLALRRAPAAAGAAPHGSRSYDCSSGCSTGMPAGTSSGSATSASGATGGSSEPGSDGSASAAGSSGAGVP